MRVIATRALPPAVLAQAKAAFDLDTREDDTLPTPAELAGYLRDYDIIWCTLGDAFTAEVFAQVPSPRARLLANFGVGYNHIDVAAAKALGVQVTNTPGAVTDATADIAMGLILMAARRLGEGERLVRAGRWQGWRPTQMLGLHITGKTLGVIGMGRIGQAIAKRAHYGFGMEVIYHNRSPRACEVPSRQVEFADAMKADVVVIAVPGGPENRHLIDAEALAQMAPHAVFVNIARGDVVDEAALARALAQGQIAAAGLDVYEFEPAVSPSLLALDNVVLLPHLGTASLEVRESMGEMALANMLAFKAGLPLLNPVT